MLVRLIIDSDVIATAIQGLTAAAVDERLRSRGGPHEASGLVQAADYTYATERLIGALRVADRISESCEVPQ